jgi:hypothetical protein
MVTPSGPTEAQQEADSREAFQRDPAPGSRRRFPRSPAGEVPMMNGPTRLAPCDACDEVGYTRPIGGLLWHDGCFIF